MGSGNFTGIRLKLIGISMLLIVITALPLGLIFDDTVQNALLKNYIATSSEHIKTIYEATKIFQEALDKDLKMFATDPLIMKADDTITTYMDNADVLYHPMTPSKNGGIEQDIYQAFEHYGKIHTGTFYVFMGTESGGFIQWPETTNMAYYDPRIRPWYLAAMEGGDQISRTNPYADATTGLLLSSHSTIIKDSDGKVIGAMVIEASSEKITEIINDIKIGETGYCMIVHKSGMVLADPKNPEHNLQYLKNINIEGFDKIVDYDQMQMEITIKGVKYFINSIKDTDSDWIIVSLITSEELYKTSMGIRYIIMIVSFIILLIGFVLTFITSEKIARPIEALSDVARRIAGGNLHVIVEQRGTNDEVGILEKSIARMMENLQKMFGELETKNGLLAKEIVERKLAEKALQQANDGLEVKVEMRTEELMAVNEELTAMNEELSNTLEELQQTQKQLIQSGKMASLGRLVAGVAHEVNTPIGISVTAASYLYGISKSISKMYYEGILKKENLQDYLAETEESMSIVMANLNRAAHLINSFKKVSVDQSNETKRVFIVGQYLEEVILTLQPKFKRTNIKIAVKGDEKLEIYGYAGAFAQIVTNLLENSLVHAYEQETPVGCIEISFHTVDEYFYLTYTDDGKGMPSEVTAHIFDPFFTTKRDSGGTGLGMHIVYNIVTQNFGGVIECSSVEGEGTTFTISFLMEKKHVD